MNRRTKWVLGVTVALITVASLRFTVGHQHRHHNKNHHQCASRWHQKGESGQQKPQSESQTNQ